MLFFPFFLNFRFIGLFSPVSPPAGTREKDPKANKAQLCMHKHTDTLLHTALRAKRLTSYEFCIWGLCGGTPTSFSGAFSRCWPFRKFRYVWRRWLDAPEQYANSVLCIEQTTWRPICLDIFYFSWFGRRIPQNSCQTGEGDRPIERIEQFGILCGELNSFVLKNVNMLLIRAQFMEIIRVYCLWNWCMLAGLIQRLFVVKWMMETFT